MRTEEIEIYKFSELSEESQQRAIEGMAAINIDYGWWDSVYEDANNIGIVITGFDISRCCITIKCEDLEETFNKIIKEHDNTCNTYMAADTYLCRKAELVAIWSNGMELGIVTEDNQQTFDIHMADLDREFMYSLKHDCLDMLTNEYRYRISAQSIKESIISYEYEFLGCGQHYH